MDAAIEAYYAAHPELRAPGTAPGPTPLGKAARLGQALATHALAGFPEADDDIVAARLATCRACDRFDAARVVCRDCGCYLQIKTRWSDQQCPIGLW